MMLEEKLKEYKESYQRAPSNWGTDDVHSWLKSLHLDCYSPSFRIPLFLS